MPTKSRKMVVDREAIVRKLRGRLDGFLNHASILDLDALEDILKQWFEDPPSLRGDGVPLNGISMLAKERRLRKQGWTDQEIADGMGLGVATIERFINGRSRSRSRSGGSRAN